MKVRLIVVLVGALALGGVVTPVSAASSYRRVSDTTFRPTETKVSGNGRYVVFVASPQSYGVSPANPTGVPNTADARQIWVKDLKSTAPPELVSASTRGTPGNYDSRHPSISADGRYVVFASMADNLIAGDTNTVDYSSSSSRGWDVFLRDRKLRRTTRVNLDVRGRQLGPRALSDFPTISADGSTIAYLSQDNVLASASHTDLDKMATYVIPRGGKPSQVRLVNRRPDGTPVTFQYQLGSLQPAPALSSSGRYLVSLTDRWQGMPTVLDLRTERATVLGADQVPPFLLSTQAPFAVARVAIDGAGAQVLFELHSETGFYLNRRSLLLWNLRAGTVRQVDGTETRIQDPTATTGDKVDPVLAFAGESAFSGNGRYVVYTRADVRTISIDGSGSDLPFGQELDSGDPGGTSAQAFESYRMAKVVKRDLRTAATTDIVTCDPVSVQTCLGTYLGSLSGDGSVVSFIAVGALDATDPDGPMTLHHDRVRVPTDVYVRTG